ncbi:MAG TPA: MurR/RpiR family transcriptional regulator [Blastocatellia bacterium]|nr:MurR/RpiR family transcriptional regulator [Blastocatellia bacterium]
MSNSMSRRKGRPGVRRDGMKPSPTALQSRFAEAQPRLGPTRQRLIRDILDNCEETCFLSSRELAKRYDVDAATVVRTVQAIGYKGFADFSADLRQHFVTRITPYTVLKAATQEKRSVADHIDHSLDKALENLNAARRDLDRNRIIELAKLIHRSRRILIVGVDFAASLSYYFAYGLTTLGFDAEAPVGSEGNLQHKVKLLDAKDLLIAISFGQCLRVTVEAVLRAGKQGVASFGITDSESSPIARYCDGHLIGAVASPSFLNSYVAPMALINAIEVACAHLNPKRSLNRLRPTDKEYVSGRRWYREPKSFNGDTP